MTAVAIELSSIFERMGVPLRVACTPEKGKHAVALQPIALGTVLFEECPIVSWPFCEAAQHYTLCSACIKVCGPLEVLPTDSDPSRNTVRCDQEGCTSVFCCEDCQRRTAAQHQFLCHGTESALRKQLEPTTTKGEGEDGAAPSVTIEALGRCVAHIASKYVSVMSAYPSASQNELFDAASASFNRLIAPPSDTPFEVDVSSWYNVVRQTMGPALRHKLPEGVVEALLSQDTLETLLGQASINAQALTGEVVHAADGNAGKNVKVQLGAGIFTLQSCFNHSCDPNAYVSYTGTHEIAVVAKRDISPGEEVTITYIPDLFLVVEDASARRKRLAQYYFVCECARCVAECNSNIAPPLKE